MRRLPCLRWLLSAILALPGLGWTQRERPFPENRLRDFYRDQAVEVLDQGSPRPALLPQFPGLDGGAWGHWGQNPESDNYDPGLNEIDFGGLLMQVTKYPGGVVPKGVSVRCGEFTALFDPEKMTYVATWKGDLALWASRRYGITSGVSSNGPQGKDLKEARWNVPDSVERRYLGFHRHGERIVFVYRIGSATIYDSPGVKDGTLGHWLGWEGTLPDGVSLVSRLPRFEDLDALRRWTAPGPSLWREQMVTTTGVRGSDEGPFAMDTLTIPYREQNPFQTPMRIGGVDILGPDRIAVSTLMGDVWIVSGVNDDLKQLTWSRYASGLHQPLGLVVHEGEIYVLGRDQLTRLRDRNGDGEADFYECVTHDFPTSKGNSFALTLHRDAKGSFYWFTRSGGFGVTRFAPESKPLSMATGLRGANGTGVSPDGSVVLALPQEGTWQPASAIFEVEEGSYHGHFGPRPEFGIHGYQLPLCFLPRGIDNSSGDALFLPEDDRLGPLSGQIIGTSFGYCQHYLVLREEIGGGVQGGVIPLPGEFLSGAHRLRFHPFDGCIYVAGTDGWQSYARENGSLQRLRYTGKEMVLSKRMETRDNGIIIHFDQPVDPNSLRLERAFAQQWNYLYSAAYGSPEYSVRSPGTQGHDTVEIQGLHPLEDGRAVFVEIPQLHPVMQLHLYLELRTQSGEPVVVDYYGSVFQQGEPFSDFAGYQPVTKEPWNDFPKAEESPVDPRLVAQEKLGKIVGDEEKLAAIAKLEVRAVAGLQFEPRTLRVKAGARVALHVVNEDVSLPHNFVLVKPGSLQRVGEGSMRLAALPGGAGQHYVIEDEGVLAFSPILPGGASYLVYFDAPEQPGEYPYLCTFPGHWQVTRGILVVEE